MVVLDCPAGLRRKIHAQTIMKWGCGRKRSAHPGAPACRDEAKRRLTSCRRVAAAICGLTTETRRPEASAPGRRSVAAEEGERPRDVAADAVVRAALEREG